LWLKENYPNESKWDKITEIDCDNNQLTNLNGIESLSNLKYLDCDNNQLTKLFDFQYYKNKLSKGYVKSLNLDHIYLYPN